MAETEIKTGSETAGSAESLRDTMTWAVDELNSLIIRATKLVEMLRGFEFPA
jgi:hypothetical protein